MFSLLTKRQLCVVFASLVILWIVCAPPVSVFASQELTFMHYLSAWDGEALNELVAKFNATHPDIQVDSVCAVPFRDKFVLAAAGGTPPDVALAPPQDLAQFVSEGLLKKPDLSRFELVGISADAYVPGAWNVGIFDGELYGVPFGIAALGVFYNPTLFEESGLPPVVPTDIDAFMKVVDKLNVDANSDGVWDRAAIQMLWPLDLMHLWYSVLKQYDGDIFEGKRVIFGNAAGRQATVALTELFAEKGLVIEPFLMIDQGKSAMMINGTWARALVQNIDYRTAPLPQFGVRPAAWGDGQYLVIPKAERDPERWEALYTFIDWLSDQGMAWAMASGHLPTRWEVIQQDEFQQSLHHQGFAEEAAYLYSYPTSPYFGRIFGILVDMINNAVREVDSPLNLLENAVREAAGVVGE